MSQSHESFGKYILLEKLQTGGMAEVFLGRAPGASGISRFVAIKRILPHFSEQTEFVDMFKDEAKIAVNLSHANIVSIYEFGVEEQQFYLAMDYVEGRNLRQILNKMKKSNVGFSIEQVLFVIKEVAAGLDHAHRCIDTNTGRPLNIIHRDMSPQNIMLSFEGEVKIIDFGIAKAETQLDNTRTGTLKGKFGYMSPEQAEGMTLDLRTDIFALGIILWELLANDRLFIANNEVNTLRKIRDCQIPSLRKINPNIPPELERIVGKALAKDRNLRYQTAAAFEREISRFLNRQYPDFSPQDFSVFVKTLFAVEILESRKKMVEYAKTEPKAHVSTASVAPAPAPKAPKVDDVKISNADDVVAPEGLAQTLTSSITENTFSDLNNIEDNQDSDDDVVDFGSVVTNQNALSKNSKKPEAPTLPEKVANAFKVPTPPARATDAPTSSPAPTAPPIKVAPVASAILKPRRDTGLFDLSHSTKNLEVDRSSFEERENSTSGRNRVATTVSKANSQTKIPKKTSRKGPLTAAFLVLAVVVGAGLFLKNLPSSDFEQTKKEAMMVIAKTLGIHQNSSGSATLSSESNSNLPTHNVAITSKPSGAEIWIDDKSIGESTPYVLKVTDGKTIKVSFRMSGYKTEERTVSITSAKTVSAELKEKRVGYLDIQVKGLGQIIVDGKVVASGSPANGVEVPAGEPVLVTVVDSINQAYAEKSVVVAEGKRLLVELVPMAIDSRSTTSKPRQ